MRKGFWIFIVLIIVSMVLLRTFVTPAQHNAMDDFIEYQLPDIIFNKIISLSNWLLGLFDKVKRNFIDHTLLSVSIKMAARLL